MSAQALAKPFREALSRLALAVNVVTTAYSARKSLPGAFQAGGDKHE